MTDKKALNALIFTIFTLLFLIGLAFPLSNLLVTAETPQSSGVTTELTMPAEAVTSNEFTRVERFWLGSKESRNRANAHLDSLGQAGWKIVEVVHTQRNDTVFVFMEKED